jgi:GDP-4-dehydro-6-deoxy-D-mannose reductase
MSLRALVTGAEGFVGRVLCDHLTAQGWEVVPATRVARDRADAIACDITHVKQVHALMAEAGAVTHVFHLAAISFVPDTLKDPGLATRVNIEGTLNVATVLREHRPGARLVNVGSAAIYGTPLSTPITEDHPLNPDTPYAITKAAADRYCDYYHQAEGLDVIRMRPFNHSGPGQSDAFVLSSFAKQIAAVEAGQREPVLHVGNLNSGRDFSHVADVVRAYEVAALHGKAGEAYNVASGVMVRIGDVLNRLIELSDAEVAVEVDEKRLRPLDDDLVYGSCDRLHADTGWKPERNLDHILGDLLGYWRAQFSAPAE